MSGKPPVMLRAIEPTKEGWRGYRYVPIGTQWIYWNKYRGWSTDRLDASHFAIDEVDRWLERAHAELPPAAYCFRPVPTSPLHSREDCGICKDEGVD